MIVPESGPVPTVVVGAEVVVASTIVVVVPSVVGTGGGDGEGETTEVVDGAVPAEQATKATTPNTSHGEALTGSAYRRPEAGLGSRLCG